MGVTLENIRRVRQEADCLFTAEQSEAAIDRLAEEITDRYKDNNPLLICVMNGGLIVAGCLLSRLDFPLEQDYLHATRYREKTAGEELQWLKTNECDMRDRYVLIIDDILDEGYTLDAIDHYCRQQGARQVLTAVLAEKMHKRGNNFKADFVGLNIIDRYVFGMGMDYKGYLRHLPAIYAVKGL